MTVLIIGGSIGGLGTIHGFRKLNKSEKIILVEPKGYLEFAWGSYRSLFHEDMAAKSMHKLDKLCEKENIEHIRSTVVTLTNKQATLANDQIIDFDVCVVAVGAATKWPALGRGIHEQVEMESRLNYVKNEGGKLLDAGSVLVVGGGLIGVETAGDLAAYAQKAGKNLKVTLVHSGEHLTNELSPKAAAMVQNKLEKHGVKVYLHDKAMERDGKMVLASSGEVLEANQVVMTNGIQPINCFMDPSCLDNAGWIKVDEFFRVENCGGKIFAIGDCCTLFPNSGVHIFANIKVIGRNVHTSLNAIKDGKTSMNEIELGKGVKGVEAYCITIGPNDGVFYAGFHTQHFLPWLKNKTMFYSHKSELGL